MLALLAGAYACGRWSVDLSRHVSSAPGGAGNASVAPMIEEEQIGIFNEALQLLKQRKPAEAEMVLKSALLESPELPFANFVLAQSYRQQGDDLKAAPLLRESVEKGEAVVPSLLILAHTSRSLVGSELTKNNYFSEAMRSDPLRFDAFYAYGQALRSQGRMAEAVERFREALIRAQTPVEVGFIEARLALTRVEAGDNAIAAELHAIEQKEDPAVAHLWVAAAALAVQENNPAKAAQLLERARENLFPEIFRVLLSDQFFATSSDIPELARFFREAPSTAGGAVPGASPAAFPSQFVGESGVPTD